MNGKRVDVRIGSFACSLQGFDDPAQPLAALLRLVQERMEAPELTNGTPLFDQATLARLQAEIAPNGGDTALSATPGVVLTLRPAVEEAASDNPTEEAAAAAPAGFAGLAQRLDPGADVLAPPADEAEERDAEAVAPAPDDDPAGAEPSPARPEEAAAPADDAAAPTDEAAAPDARDAEAPADDSTAADDEPFSAAAEPAAEPWAPEGPGMEPEPDRPLSNIFADPDEPEAPSPGPGEAEEPEPLDEAPAEAEAGGEDPPGPATPEEPAAARVVNIFGDSEGEGEDDPVPIEELGAEPVETQPAEPEDDVTNIFADPDGDEGHDDENVTPLKGHVSEFRRFLRERETADPQDEPLREVSLDEVVKSAGAEQVPDLIAASAAWLDLARGQGSFTRKEVIAVFDGIPGEHPKSLEAKIKGFGRLVRNGQLVNAGTDRFRLSDEERTRFSRLID